MACRGLFLSLSDDEVEQLRRIGKDSARINRLHEMEEEYFARMEQRKAECDKSWDAMHRTLTNGRLTPDGGTYPLNHVVLGGHSLYSGGDYIFVLKTAEQVRDVAAVVPAMAKSEFRSRYFAIPQSSYLHPLEELDFEYTWAYFEDVRAFWLLAASEGRQVVFVVDQ